MFPTFYSLYLVILPSVARRDIGSQDNTSAETPIARSVSVTFAERKVIASRPAPLWCGTTVLRLVLLS